MCFSDTASGADACLTLGGLQTAADPYGLVRTLAAVETAATIVQLTLGWGGVVLAGGWAAASPPVGVLVVPLCRLVLFFLFFL